MNRVSTFAAMILVGVVATIGGSMSVTPASHGYPDWGRQLAQADVMIANTTPQLDGITVIGSFFVGTAPYVTIRISHTAGHGAFLQWNWRIAVGGNVVGTDQMDTRTTAPNGRITIPVMGPVIEFIGATNPNNNFITLTVYAVSESSALNMANFTNVLISANMVNIGAGIVDVRDATGVRAGWVYWHAAFEFGTIYRMRLFAVERDGTQHLLDFMESGGSTLGRMVFVPPKPLRLESNNGDAVARDLLAVVTYHPYWH